MTELAGYVKDLTEGLDPNNPHTIALIEAAIARPIPAIEKPLGPDREQTTETVKAAEPVVLIDNLGGWTDWNAQMRGRERTG